MFCCSTYFLIRVNCDPSLPKISLPQPTFDLKDTKLVLFNFFEFADTVYSRYSAVYTACSYLKKNKSIIKLEKVAFLQNAINYAVKQLDWLF